MGIQGNCDVKSTIAAIFRRIRKLEESFEEIAENGITNSAEDEHITRNALHYTDDQETFHEWDEFSMKVEAKSDESSGSMENEKHFFVDKSFSPSNFPPASKIIESEINHETNKSLQIYCPKLQKTSESVAFNEKCTFKRRNEMDTKEPYDKVESTNELLRESIGECILKEMLINQRKGSFIAKERIECPPGSSIKYPQTDTKTFRKENKKQKPLVCKICAVVFETLSQRKEHMQAHKEQDYRCEKCDKKFSRSDHLKKHMRSHIKQENEFPDEDEIDEDEKKRRQRRIYRKRMLEKEDAKNMLYPCEYSGCDKVFNRRKNMKDHMVIHTEKPLQCELCAKRFHTKHNLNRHIRLKHQIKTWPCKLEDCDEVFKLSIERRNHMRRHKLYQCHLCAKRFDQRY